MAVTDGEVLYEAEETVCTFVEERLQERDLLPIHASLRRQRPCRSGRA